MLGVGWTEMLIIGVVALIVIGPKELPAVMQKIGRFAGMVRRMGSDFQRELNKTTGLDEVRNLRTSITQPLKATTDAIRREFNTTTSSGAVQPSGALKPADPKAESVVAEIQAAAGIKPAEPAKAAAAATAVTATPVKAKRVVKAKAAPVAAVSTDDLPPVTPTPRPRRPAAKPKTKPVEGAAPPEAVAPSAATPPATAKRRPAAKRQAAPKPDAPGTES